MLDANHLDERAKLTRTTACDCEGLPYSVSSSVYSDSGILREMVKVSGVFVESRFLGRS
jgi:hypothetical protein